jgi:Zn finger protein HypA/HybF involved in hydrogenase expression
MQQWFHQPLPRQIRYGFSKLFNTRLSGGKQNACDQFRSVFMVDEKVKIKCTKCSQVFRERAQKIRNGFQTNCQHCNRLITFDTSSEDRNIRRALMSAKEVRMALAERSKEEPAAQG